MFENNSISPQDSVKGQLLVTLVCFGPGSNGGGSILKIILCSISGTCLSPGLGILNDTDFHYEK